MKMYITTYQINKPKVVRFLKFKFLFIIKLNFNGGQFKNKTGMDRFQDCCKAKATNALLQSQMFRYNYNLQQLE